MSPQFELSAFLGAIRRRWRWLIALSAAAVATTGMAVALAALAAAFRLLHPAPDALLALSIGALAAGSAWAVRALRPAIARIDDGRIARFVEERRPEFEDGLVTAVEVRHRDHTFASAIIASAAMQARQVEPDAIVPPRDLHRAAGRGAVACALLLVAGGVSLGPLDQAFDAARVRLFPSRLSLSVEPGNARVVAGAPLTLRARVEGLPRGFDASAVVNMSAGSRTWRQTMKREGTSFVLAIPAVAASFKYGVNAAGVRSPEFNVTVLHRPTLQRIDVSYRYPPYTGMPAREEADTGDIYAPAGTRVTLRARSDKHLTSGTLMLGSRAIALGPAGDPQVRETSFVVERDGSYRIDLTDADGLRSEPSSEYFVRVTDDRPPEVRIVRPESDRQVTPLEEVDVAAQAEDDYRVASLELVYAVGAQAEKVVPLTRASGQSLSGSHMLPVEDLKVRPGDVIRAYARAREPRPGGRQVRSEMLLLEVAPFDQQFAFAQSQAGAMGGGELESLIQAQKNILNGTWNLLRREAAGRSDADVKALATAQTELKRRTEPQGGVAPPRASSDDPLPLAAAAMGRAADALGRAKLPDAVPQEMEALTQLGRALAENKRREVAQQRGGGGGGGNRSSEDLSTLFDRELLRQQQTNYENRQASTSEERDPESDWQKRVRELAERQDDLAREQRRLAQQQLTEEERRRQLERLTREQEELRQQAEQLARELQRRQAGSQSQQSESLKEAAEQMRGSAGDMRRNDPASASQRGSEAAERLRGAQQPSSGGQTQPQSLGELQMEAQQLSDAQRRLDQQSKEGGRAGAEAQRRERADAQNRLAERVDRLERAAKSLAGGRGDQRERQAAAQAARELDRQRVSGRMREQAQKLQRGGAPQSSAEGDPDRSLSSALERVAEQLGAGTDAETRRLAGEMARNRAARQKLEETARRLEGAQREGNTDAQEELRNELQRGQQTLRDLQQRGDRPDSGMGRSAPEQHEWSRSAPGLESFKQDFARWEQLKRDITLALERRDLTIAQQLKRQKGSDGVNAGSVEELPNQYRTKVSRYFEALARAGRRHP